MPAVSSPQETAGISDYFKPCLLSAGLFYRSPWLLHIVYKQAKQGLLALTPY